MISTGEEVEVRSYKRLTELIIMDQALGKLSNVQPGDCIVCFNKQDIYSVSRGLEKMGVECAVIYGSLPPGTKLAMADKFNDPADPCKVSSVSGSGNRFSKSEAWTHFCVRNFSERSVRVKYFSPI